MKHQAPEKCNKCKKKEVYKNAACGTCHLENLQDAYEILWEHTNKIGKLVKDAGIGAYTVRVMIVSGEPEIKISTITEGWKPKEPNQ